MKTRFQAENPETIEMTLTVTMPLAAWRKLREQLGEGYPGWELRSAISGMVLHATKHFEGKTANGGDDGSEK